MKRLAVLFALLLFAGTAIIGLARAKSQSATAGFTAGTPINAAFYYPWFPETWHSADHFKPELGQYASSNAAIRASHIAMLKYAGIQAGVLSWWGQRTKTDSRLAGYLNAGAAQRFPQTVYYEKEGIGDPSVQDIRSDLTYLRKYADQPDGAWLHVDGRPVIFVYGDGGESCATASRWAAATAGTSWYVVLKVFRGYLTCHDQPASWHQYGPAVSEDTQPKYSMSISPGFWKYDESTPRLPRDPTRWARN